jgi:hypothetical protein
MWEARIRNLESRNPKCHMQRIVYIEVLGSIMENGLMIILLLLGTFPLYSQKYDSLKDSWDKIIISDSYGGWSYFNNGFEVKKVNEEFCLTNKSDSVIGKINPGVLKDFFESLTNEDGIAKDPLKVFGRDSIWLINNAEKLWFTYLGDRNEPPEVDTLAIKIIKDYSRVKRLVWSIQGSHWTDDYPFTSVAIIKNQDTLVIESFGQYPFMMPWIVKGRAIYNSGIPSSIAKILPENIKTNRSRLAGERFEHYLVERIYETFIEEYREYFRAKSKYPRQFSTLEKHYRIEDAELTDMTSIEWGGFMSAPCLELVLKSKKLPENISLNVVYGRRIKLHSVRPIIKQEAKLIKRLSNNRIYQYTAGHSHAIGEIHFVNRKSLSGEAKRNFKKDLKDNGVKKNMFRGKFRHAIFYELTDRQNERNSFSRWIFLKDGTLILWEINGDFLMDLNPEIVKEKGYVCRVITSREWEK